MTVRTRQECGAMGHAAMVAAHPLSERREWSKRGGRKPNRTLAEIEAAEEAARQAARETKRLARQKSKREARLIRETVGTHGRPGVRFPGVTSPLHEEVN